MDNNRILPPVTFVGNDSIQEEVGREVVQQKIVQEAPTLMEELSAGYVSWQDGRWKRVGEFLEDSNQVYDTEFNIGEEDKWNTYTAGLNTEHIKQFTPNLLRARNEEHAVQIRQDIDNYIKLQQVSQHDSGFVGTAAYSLGAIAGVVTDPVNALFGAGVISKFYKVAKMAVRSDIAAGVVTGATLGGVQAKIGYELSQGGYSQTQAEYENALTYGMLLGGGAGALFGGLVKFNGKSDIAEARVFADEFMLKKELSNLQVENAKRFMAEGVYGDAVVKQADGTIVPREATDGNLGAARMPAADIDYRLAEPNNPNGISGALTKYLTKPLTETFLPKYRALGNELASVREYFVKMSPYSAKLTNNNPNLPAEILRDTITAEGRYKLRAGEDESLLMAQQVNPKMSRKALLQEADLSMKTNTPSQNPGVRNLVENHIQPLFKQMHDEAVARGFFEPRDLQGGYYYPQLEDTQKILNNMPTAVIDYAKGMKNNAIKQEAYLRADAQKADQRLQSLVEGAQKELEALTKAGVKTGEKVKALKKLAKHIKNVDKNIDEVLRVLGREAELESITKDRKLSRKYFQLQQMLKEDNFSEAAQRHIDKKISKGMNHVTSTSFRPDQYKELTLHVDTADIKNFLSDRPYLEQLGAYIEDHARAVAKFDTYGDLTGEMAMKKVKSEYEQRIIGLDSNSKEYKKLTADYQEGVNMLKKTNALFDGTKIDGSARYSAGDAVYDIASTLANAKLMATSAISQITDLAGPAIAKGFGKFGKFHQAAVNSVGAEIKALSKAELQMVGAIQEGFDFNLLQRSSDLVSPDSGLGKFSITDSSTWAPTIGRGTRAANNLIFTANGMRHMNALSRSVVSESVTRNMVEAAIVFSKNPEKLGEEALQNFAKYGITKDDLVTIADQFNKHKQNKNGHAFANILDWDVDIRRKVLGAVKSEVDMDFVIQPSGTTKGYWMSGPVLRFLAKYQGFMYQAMESYGLAATQRGGTEEMAKFFLRNMLGSTAYVLKALMYKPWEEIDMSPERMIFEGFTRSGTDMGLGYVGFQLDAIGNIGGFTLGPKQQMGWSQAKTFRTNNVEDLIYGASAVPLGDINNLVDSAAKGKFLEVGARTANEYNPLVNNPFVKLGSIAAFGYDDK